MLVFGETVKYVEKFPLWRLVELRKKSYKVLKMLGNCLTHLWDWVLGEAYVDSEMKG